MRIACIWLGVASIVAMGCDSPSRPPAREYFRAIAVSAGWNHTCALDLEGAAWCWGFGRNGELGVDTATLGSTPMTNVPMRVSGGLRFTAIGSGEGFTCALTAQGAAWCWGSNRGHSLGNPATGSGCASPCSTVPVPVAGGHQFTRLFVNSIACGLASSGDLYCWGGGFGAGSFGPLLMGADSAATPVRIVAEDGSDPAWESVAAGVTHACAATTQRRVACWGSNLFAALGVGDTVPRYVGQPRFVAGATNLHAAVTFAFGGCALDDNGRAMCWGSNELSLLGTGSATHQLCRPGSDCSPVPVAVAASTALVSLTGGFGTVCGLTADGAALCWGNFPGPNHEATRVATPTPLSTSVRFNSLAFMGLHQCGLGTDGLVYCWGYNPLGQTGGSIGYVSAPTPIPLPAP